MRFTVLTLVIIIVTIDNALLCGLLMPKTSKKLQQQVAFVVGIALCAVQTVIAIGTGVLLNNQVFRICSVVVLAWMCIMTMRKQPDRDQIEIVRETAEVFLLVLFGDVGNVIWLGSIHHGNYIAFILLSICSIPLFVAVALFVSTQANKYHWVSILGAVMMAWIAASLCSNTNIGRSISSTLPSFIVKVVIAGVIILLGFVLRKRKETH